jgi:hypothetical protein
MSRSIEIRLKRLEAASAPDEAPYGRVHIFPARTREEANANIAALLAAGEAAPGDFFWRILPLEADSDSAMHENYRWEGRWVR